MSNDLITYETIRKWKDAHICDYAANIFTLNEFHDLIMRKVFEAAIVHLNKGNPPCNFCWFIAGSGGRLEQGIISDQDHGIIFEVSNENNEEYFLELGKEISFGLNLVGYPYCQGKVMSSNPQWCKSIDAWRVQLFKWMEERSLETIRDLQIFYDARCLIGEVQLIERLKSNINEYQNHEPLLLKRLMESVMHIKNAIGPLGQMITINHGKYQGSVNLKYSAFLPYVNSIRILAIKEGLYETSTLDRIAILSQRNEYADLMKKSKPNFEKLLNYRLLTKRDSYEDTHFLNITNLNKADRKEVKQILKEGKKLHHSISKLVLSSYSK